MTAVSMQRNGYRRQADGNYAKSLIFPRRWDSLAPNGKNHYVEQIVRNPRGEILHVKHCNKRR